MQFGDVQAIGSVGEAAPEGRGEDGQSISRGVGGVAADDTAPFSLRNALGRTVRGWHSKVTCFVVMMYGSIMSIGVR